MAVYWVGTDGNVWVKGSNGVRNAGKAVQGPVNNPGIGGGNTSIMTSNGVITGQRIDDPNPGGGGGDGGGSPAPVYSGGGGRVAPRLNQSAVDNTQRALDELPGLLEAALDAENRTYRNVLSGFNSQEDQQRKTYDESTVTNQKNYDANYMDSIRAGIKGLGGLMALLRGTGAVGGSAEDEVRDTVGGVTANDIRVGADTQKENQGQLDNSLSTFLSDLVIKRKAAEDTNENNERAIRRENYSQMQDLFGKMAGFYSDAEQEDNATKWMNRAGDLTPKIAANSRAKVSTYDRTPVSVKAPELTAFAAPTENNVTIASPDGQVGSGIFTMSERRRREPALVGV